MYKHLVIQTTQARSLGNVLQKNKRFSADGQNTAQNYTVTGVVLDCNQPKDDDLQPILREEVEIAVAALKKGGVCRR